MQASNAIDVVRDVMREHTEIDLLDENQRGQILDITAERLNKGARGPFGRKARNADGSNKNTDGLTYLRTDGLFEIYDVINGTDPLAHETDDVRARADRGRFATWDEYGPFRQGENGYWAPADPVNGSGGGTGGGNPGGGETPTMDARILADIAALRLELADTRALVEGEIEGVKRIIHEQGDRLEEIAHRVETQHYEGRASILGRAITFTLAPKVLMILLLIGLATPAFAQTQETTDLLQQLRALGDQAGRILEAQAPPKLLTTEQAQAAITGAKPGATIALEPGIIYRSLTIPRSVSKITVTSAKCGALNRLVTPADAPLMATVQGTTGENYGIKIEGSEVTLECVVVRDNPPNGQGDMIRCGDATDPDIAHVPADVTIRNVLLMGNPGDVYGQKRAIAGNCRRLLIDQVWCQDIWVNGQDSTCVGIWSTPGPVLTQRSFLSAGSENYIVGGAPPASPAHLPSDITIQDSVLYKPLAWKGKVTSVKNLLEYKNGRRLIARRLWMENHWKAAQPGPAVVFTMATNGACSYCEGRDWLLEDSVIWNVSAGVSITGYQYGYAPGAGAAVGVTLRNNLFKISKATLGGTGWPVLVSNEPKNVTIDHNTFLHDGTTFVSSDYGIKWPYQEPPLPGPIKAGPLEGFVLTNNVAPYGSYGVFTAEGTAGINIATYFPGLVMGGNVLPGAGGTALARFNAFAGTLKPNVGMVLADFQTTYGADGCQQTAPAADAPGVDCTRLPFALRALVPR